MSWNIFDEDVDVIVNPVNTVGVMGKGLALAFKERYGQTYFDSYVADCQKAAGNISVFNSTHTASDGQIIYNFATKKDWRDPSSLEIINVGLDKLAAWLGNRNTSIAIPRLGCGCGSLSWEIVRPLIISKLSSVKANVCLDGVWLKKGEKQMDKKIIGPFRGDYNFLSNMFPTKVTTDLGTFRCAEAAFQAYKCANEIDVEKFKTLDGKDAKALGGKNGLRKNGRVFKVALRSDWDAVRLEKMLEVIRAKFANPTLADRLLQTGDEELCEINSWNDEFWGAVERDGKLVGANHLGQILMEVRDEIRNGEKQDFQVKDEDKDDREESIWQNIFAEAAVKISEEQKQVVREIVSDIRHGKATTSLIIGNAGTGKTTILAVLKQALCAFFGAMAGADLAICAPTNKARNVLIEKGLEKAETVHSRFMSPTEENHRTVFKGKDSGIKLKYCIVDEASMLSSYLLDILKRYQNEYGTHFVFVGDNFQLPPVEKGGQDVFARYGHQARYLTKVFRQAHGSEILDLATALRTKEERFFPTEGRGQIELMSYKNCIDEYVTALKDYHSAVAIVNSNAERNRVNAQIRTALGYGNMPVEGERLIAVANAKKGGFVNGETFELHDITFTRPVTVHIEGYGNKNSKTAGVCVVDRNGITLLLPEYNAASVYHQSIVNIEGDKQAVSALCGHSLLDTIADCHQPDPDINIAYYGYAITAHKSQGSQWDEVFLLQTQNRGDRDAVRWLYTAVTRAAKRLVICKDDNVAHKPWEEIHRLLGDTTTVKEETIMNNNNNNNKEETIMDNIIKIVSKYETKHKIMTGEATAVNIVKTYGLANKGPRLIEELVWTLNTAKAAGVTLKEGVDYTIESDKNACILTTNGLKNMKGSFISYSSKVADEVFHNLRGKIVFVRDYQVPGLIGRLAKLGLEFTVDGEKVTAPEPKKNTSKSPFTVANKIARMGEGYHIWLNGTKTFIQGQGESIVLFPNHNCYQATMIRDITKTKKCTDHVVVTDGDWFEAHFAVLRDNEIIATVYAYVAASSESEAAKIISAWIDRKGENATGWSTNNILKEAGIYPCFSVLRNKTNEKARKALAEALRAGKFEYAEVDVQIDASDVKRMIEDRVMAVFGERYAAAQQEISTLKDLVEKLKKMFFDEKAAHEKEIAEIRAELKKSNRSTSKSKAIPEPKQEPEQEPEPESKPKKFNRKPGPLPGEPAPELTSALEPKISVIEPKPVIVENVTDDEIDVIGQTFELPEIRHSDAVNPHAYEQSLTTRKEKATRVKTACATLGIKLEKLDDVVFDSELISIEDSHLYDIKIEGSNVSIKKTKMSSWEHVVLNKEGLLEVIS